MYDLQTDKVILSTKAIRVWVITFFVFSFCVLILGGLSVFFSYQTHKLANKLEAAEQQMATCQENLHTLENAPVGQGLNAQLLEALKESVDQDLEIQPHITDNLNILETVSGHNTREKLDQSEVLHPQSIVVSEEKVRFSGIQVVKSQSEDAVQVSFYVVKTPTLSYTEAPLSGSVVLACQSLKGWKIFPKKVASFWHKQETRFLYELGLDFQIRRSKRFLVDIKPCLPVEFQKSNTVYMLAISEDGEYIGKGTYEFKR